MLPKNGLKRNNDKIHLGKDLNLEHHPSKIYNKVINLADIISYASYNLR